MHAEEVRMQKDTPRSDDGGSVIQEIRDAANPYWKTTPTQSAIVKEGWCDGERRVESGPMHGVCV